MQSDVEESLHPPRYAPRWHRDGTRVHSEGTQRALREAIREAVQLSSMHTHLIEAVQSHAITCNHMQSHAITCNHMQSHANAPH